MIYCWPVWREAGLRAGRFRNITFENLGAETLSVHAYVLLNLEPAKTQSAIERLKNLPGTMVQEVLGPYDAVMEIEADTQEDITGLLRNRIRPVDGVTNTVTCIWL